MFNLVSRKKKTLMFNRRSTGIGSRCIYTTHYIKNVKLVIRRTCNHLTIPKIRFFCWENMLLELATFTNYPSRNWPLTDWPKSHRKIYPNCVGEVELPLGTLMLNVLLNTFIWNIAANQLSGIWFSFLVCLFIARFSKRVGYLTLQTTTLFPNEKGAQKNIFPKMSRPSSD